MEYDITEERRAYLEARGYTILSACPGSGKTTSIIKKLFEASAYCQKKYGKYAGVMCLSFTNKACAELLEKYSDMHGVSLKYPNEISTIDSFIMQKIVLPFWYLCPYIKSKPIVINDDDALKEIYFVSYIDKNGELKTAKNGIFKKYNTLFYSMPPQEVNIEKVGFSFSQKIISDKTELSYCKDVFLFRLSKGCITSQDALWVACRIIEQNPDIAKALVKRYPYIIVDEAQDNSEMQFSLFEMLVRVGLQNLEYVGDVCQAIYEFRNARPDCLSAIAKDDAWKTLHLTECRRSNQRIIDLYSLLKPKYIPSIKSYKVEDARVPIIVYYHDDNNTYPTINHFRDVCKRHNLQHQLLLARGDRMCLHIAGIKTEKIKYWKSDIPYKLIEAKLAFIKDDLYKAFRTTRHIIACLKFADKDKRKAFISEIEFDISWNMKIYKFLEAIPSFKMSLAEWTITTQFYVKDYWALDGIIEFEPKSKINGYKIQQLRDTPVEKFYTSSERNGSSHLECNTIHSAKGATVDAVLLFLSENSQGQNISLSDFCKEKRAEMTEKQRLIYVACSRAKQFVALVVPSTVPEEKIRETLNGVDYVIEKIEFQNDMF